MNWQHFGAFVWLRWRLLVNQLKRGGGANAVILAILGVAAIFFAAGVFVTTLLIGLFVLADVSPQVLLYVWDGLAGLFLVVWAIGLLSDLQRSEALSLDRFLHLPVSIKGAFLVNYLSSIPSVALLICLPPMLALALALVADKGPLLLLQFPLLAAFLLMVTGVTYQFQGWLASLMVNKRRRRTIVVAVTAAFILLFQLPNLINILRPWESKGPDESAQWLSEQNGQLERQLKAHEIDDQEYQRRQFEIQREYQTRTEEATHQALARLERIFQVANLVLPPGWLPLGASDAAAGQALPALLGTLGMGGIGAASLWRSYRTTLRLYTGDFTSGKPRAKALVAPVAAARPTSGTAGRTVLLLEWKLPWLSEPVSAVALSSFRSLTRAPEAKMILLSPIILIVVLGSTFWRHPNVVPEGARPLVAYGIMTLMMLTSSGILGNQFGFDRSGFRVLVLSAVPRREILLGKNLAFAPLALGLTALLVVLMQLVLPLRLEHFLAVLPQFLGMYFSYCVLANWLSILAPMAIRAGSFKAVNARATPVLLHLAMAFVSPLVFLPALLPLGVEFVLQQAGWIDQAPVSLALALIECPLVLLVYRLLLDWQGDLLQAREQKILETVATRAE